MTKEVDEIIFEMKKNMSSPMRIFQSFMDHIFIKWLARGILRWWGDEVMRRLFEAYEEGFGGSVFFLRWFWEIIVEVLEGDEGEAKLLDF
jgi:hypothetical protein